MKKIPKLRFKKFNKEWNMEKFENCFEFLRNNTFSRNELSYESGLVKNIHYGDILTKFDIILKSNNNKIPFINSEISLKSFQEKDYLKSGDLIISDTAEDFSVGKAVEVINDNNSKILAGLHTHSCRTLKSFYIGYLGQYINSNAFHDRLNRNKGLFS